MAEVITIAEIDINYEKAVEDAVKLKGEVGLLAAQLKKAKDETGEASAETIQYEVALKTAKSELRQQTKFLGDVTIAQNSTKGSQKQLSAQLAFTTKKWRELSKDERENTETGQALTAQKLELSNALKKEEVATGTAGRNVGFYGDKLSSISPVAAKATAGAKALGVGMKVALGPIALVTAAIGALITYFNRSEEGQNKLIKITKVFELVLGNILDVVGLVGEAIFEAFSKPKESLETLGKLIKENISNRFEGLMELIPQLGKAISKLFSGDFAEAGKIAVDAVAKVGLGVEDFSEKVVAGFEKATEALADFNTEMEKEIGIALMLADRQAVIDKKVRESIVLTAKERLSLERLKNEIEEKGINSAQRRIELIEQENKILDEQAERTLAIAQEKLKLKEIENSLTSSTKEDLNEEAQLRAEVYAAESAVETQRREAITKRLEAEREIAAELALIAGEKIAVLDRELELWKEQNEERILYLEDYNARLLEQQIEAAEAKLAQDLISQEEYNEAVIIAQSEFEESEAARKLEVEKLNIANTEALKYESYYQQLDAQQNKLERELAAELKNAEKIGADTTAIRERYAQQQANIDELRAEHTVSVATDVLEAVITLFGEQTAAGKAAAIAIATIETLQSAVSSFKSMASIPYVGPILGGIAAAAALVSGYATIDQIVSVDTNPKSSGGSTAKTNTYSGVQSAVSQANTSTAIQSVNTAIGQGIVTRDTASINQDTQTPTVAVVVDDVTEAQSTQTEKAIISET